MASRRSFLKTVGASAAAFGTGSCVRRLPASSSVIAPGPISRVIRLGANENPYGPGPAARAAIQRAVGEANRYPFPIVGQLTEAIGSHVRVETSCLALGCGSTELLDAAVSAFTSKDRCLVTAAPTFEATARRASTIGSRVIAVPVDEHGELNLEGMAERAGAAGLVYVCNPNNPTGTVCDWSALETFVTQVHERSSAATILIDEAYHDYVESPSYRTAISLAVADPRVIVTRTFSKVYGMAGLRIGYLVGRAETLRDVRPWLGSLGMANLGAAAAVASLEDPVHVEQQRTLNHEARQVTRDAFERAGHRSFASEANFLMIDVGRDARAFAASCMTRGIQVARAFPPLTNHARISIGTRAEMNRAIPVFLDILAQPPSMTTLFDFASYDRHEC